MLIDCNLKFYQTLNVQSEFNIGLLILYIIEGSSNISINGKTKKYKSKDFIIINDLDHYRILSAKKNVIASLCLSRVELDYFFQFNKRYYINKDKLDSSMLRFYMNKLIVNYLNNKRKKEKRNKVFEHLNQLVMTLRLYRELMVETRHKNKINQLIHHIEMSMHNDLRTIDFNITENNLLDYILRLNACIALMHNTISNKYKINIDHFMILLFIQQRNQRTCTLKDIKNKFGWDLVKINKSIKTLVQLKYVSKKRDEKDERVVLVDIYKNVELEVNKIIEEVLAEYINNYGEQNLAMVK